MPLTALLCRVTVIVSLAGKLLIVKQPLTGVLILVDVVRSVAVGAGLSGRTVMMMFAVSQFNEGSQAITCMVSLPTKPLFGV